MTNKKLIVNKLIGLGVIVAILFVFMLSTNPHEVALPLLMLPFLIIGVVTYKFGILANSIAGKQSAYKYKMFPLSFAFLVTCLMLLQSLHQLTWKDTLLVLVFTVLLWLYISKADFLNKK